MTHNSENECRNEIFIKPIIFIQNLENRNCNDKYKVNIPSGFEVKLPQSDHPDQHFDGVDNSECDVAILQI